MLLRNGKQAPRHPPHCRTADGERVNVEMCLNPDSYELARLEERQHLLAILDRGGTMEDIRRELRL